MSLPSWSSNVPVQPSELLVAHAGVVANYIALKLIPAFGNPVVEAVRWRTIFRTSKFWKSIYL